MKNTIEDYKLKIENGKSDLSPGAGINSRATNVKSAKADFLARFTGLDRCSEAIYRLAMGIGLLAFFIFQSSIFNPPAWATDAVVQTPQGGGTRPHGSVRRLGGVSTHTSPTLARLSFYVPPNRMAEFEAVYNAKVAPILKTHGLMESAQRGRATVDNVFSRLFELN